VRCVIYSRDTTIRIYSVPQLIYKIYLSNSNYATKLWAPRNIFAGLFNERFLQIWPYPTIVGKTICSGPRRSPGRQAHGSAALARRHHVRCPCDFLGLVNTSMTSLVRNDERHLVFSPAVPQAFLGVSDLRAQFLLFVFSS
jgi:hypothetical protein